MSASVSSRPDVPVVGMAMPPGGGSHIPSPRRGSSDSNHSKEVVLPQLRSSDSMIDKTKPLPTSLQSDFIPDDVLFALTQPPVPRDQLGPASRHRNLCTTAGPPKQKPANLWNFKRKERYKHLSENTPCVCGAGRDISFLYDVPQPKSKAERPDKFDPSMIRREMEERRLQGLKLPDTLLPDEYHIVKNKGVMGIEYHEDKYSTQPEDHEKHLVVFPSLKPAGRYEVIQLKQAMGEMLDKAGVNDDDVEIKGPTQMHNLLELIKKEQNIYNVIFHELIRQVSIECLERGELMADLRNKYSGLLSKVPHQIKSLHEEVLAQRALDRRLTEELMRFKATITILTNELSEVKEHDRRVTREAQDAQEDLRTALTEAQKNASLLAEYHELYELQRKRLETQVDLLTQEKEIWSTASYCLALKVTEESKLTTAKRLHVNEKAWAKLASHFTILLSDNDTDLLTKIQSYVERWRDLIEDFNMALRKKEEEMKSELKTVKNGIERWIVDFQKICFSKDGHFQKAPEMVKVQQMQEEIKSWEQVLQRQTESYAGETFLTSEEELIHLRKQMENWTDSAFRCFGRHRSEGGQPHPDQASMVIMNEEVDELIKQYYIRLTGENGGAQGIIHLLNVFETWGGKLNSHLNSSYPINDSEWSRFHFLLEDWLSEVKETIDCIGVTQKIDDRIEGKEHLKRDIFDVVRKSQKWVTSAANSIDSEDAKLVEQVSSLHSEMVKWMVQMLLRLAPNKPENSKEASDMALLGSATVTQLQADAKSLFERLHLFSNYVTLCCDGIVMDNTQRRRENREDNAEHEYRDLQRLRSECEDWVHTAKILMSQLTGEPIDTLFPPRPIQSEQSLFVQKTSQQPELAYTDQEKLENADDEDEVETVAMEGVAAAAETAEFPVEGGVTPLPPAIEISPSDPAQSQSQAEQAGTEEKSEMDIRLSASEETLVSPEDQGKTEDGEEEDGEEEGMHHMEVIGFDLNTHIQALERVTPEIPQKSTSSVKPGTPTQRRAVEALVAMDTLQIQLLESEERYNDAEERAAAAESELAVTMEKVRALEKQVKQLQVGTSQETDKASSGSVKSGSKDSVKASKEDVVTDMKTVGSSESKPKRPDSQVSSHSRSSSKSSTKSKKK